MATCLSLSATPLFVCVCVCVFLCIKVRAGEPVRNALRLMLEHEISGIPVLNDQGVLLDMYCDSGKG